MFRLILGRSGTGKSTMIYNCIRNAGAQRRQVLLVPDQNSYEAERALCTITGNSASLYAEVLTFHRLCNRVFLQKGGLGVPEMDGGGRILMMHKAVKKAAGNGLLKVCRTASDRPAFLKSLLATADELKSHCVSPDMLLEVAYEVEDPAGEKLSELAHICNFYNEFMDQSQRLDPQDRLDRLAERLEDGEWAREKDIWVDGFSDFSPQQMKVLELLMASAHSVTVALACEESTEVGETEIFAAAHNTRYQLCSAAQKVGLGKPEIVALDGVPKGLRRPALEFLEQNLFAYQNRETGAQTGELELFAARNPRSEVEWVAARILRLVREEGYRFRDIGVVARTFGDYSDLVEAVFGKYGVPVFCSGMHDILEKPVLSLIVGALDSLESGYAYDDVFRYLKTDLTDLNEEDRDELENYVLKWNIRGSRWTQEAPWTMHPRGYGYPMEEADQARLNKLDGLRRTVIAPLKQLRDYRDGTGLQWATRLYEFLEQAGLPRKLSRRMDQLRRRGELALAEEYRQLWEILCGALEQCAQILDQENMTLNEFSGIFRLVLAQYDVGTIPVSLDRVMAGDMARQKNHRVKVLFLLGADDATIPQLGSEPSLLTDQDWERITGKHSLAKSNRRFLLSQEMTTVYETCSLPSDRLILSWAVQGSGGEERRPCFVVERLKLLFPDLREVREDALNGRFRLEAPLPALEQAGKWPQLRETLSHLPEYAPRVERLEKAERWERGRLSPVSVEQLYGRRVPMSASRMDKYKACHFSYFMKFGLKAEPRKPAGFTAPEYGTFVHYVLEYVLKTMQQEGGIAQWDEETKKRVRKLTDQAVERYVQEELGGMEQQTERFRYLFRRLRRSVQSVMDNIAQELASSQFKPISFELGFAGKGDLPPVEWTANGVTLSISGFVDRVDGWVHNGKLYLRVVDYKTGRKSFDLTEVWNGLGLQMLLYLFTLEDKGQSLYSLPVEGAGVLYLPARDLILRGSRAMSEEQRQSMIDKELVRRGLVLDDPEVLAAMESRGETGYRFLPLKVSKSTGEISGDALVSAQRLGRLQTHIQRVLEEICKELAAGNITADPYWRGPEKNACRFCDYAAACHFEEGRGGDCRRWLPSVTTKEFWERVEGREE